MKGTEKVIGVASKGFQIVNIAGVVTNLHPGFRENTVFTEDAEKK